MSLIPEMDIYFPSRHKGLVILLLLAIIGVYLTILYLHTLKSFNYFGFNLNHYVPSRFQSVFYQKCSHSTYENSLFGLNLQNWSANEYSTHPNLPQFLISDSTLPILVPDIQSIRWTGIHWQESSRFTPRFLLYSAHIDLRSSASKSNSTHIYILGLYEGSSYPEKMYCQLWINKTNTVIAMSVLHYDLIDWQGFSSKRLVPYLITCVVAKNLPIHDTYAVSLVKNHCQKATNLLQTTGSSVVGDVSKKSNQTLRIGICGPALYYFNEDFSVRLIEWIETLLMIGASKIFLYEATVHPNIKKVLKYYEAKNLVQTISFHYPPPYLDEGALRRLWTESRRQELFALENIYFSDCILRFKDQFDYLAHFDPDEIPILKKHKTLPQLLASLMQQNTWRGSTPASFLLQWKVFYPNIEPGKSVNASLGASLYMPRHNQYFAPHNDKSIDNNGKSIYDTRQVLAAFSHKPILYFDDAMWKANVKVSPSVAYTAHFRSQPCNKNCELKNFKEDNYLASKAATLNLRVKKTRRKLNI